MFDIPMGLPVGIMPSAEYKACSLSLAPNERLVVYTDGLAESRSPADGVMFQDRLEAEASGPPDSCEGILQRLVHAEKRHRGEHPPRDDLTVLVGAFE